MVYLPPNIAGYVGGDHTAVLLATQTYSTTKTLIIVDIGTNTEISIVHKGYVYSCSTASGPAFEGRHIRDGMRGCGGCDLRVFSINNEVVLPKNDWKCETDWNMWTGILKAFPK